ncbi:MAG TPA: alpha-amylase family glycosyl hydrolase [Spirochaetia bacterium]|nr:alpha-amylase family glycosyl hydrolase [Spirochaetia bacterium]
MIGDGGNAMTQRYGIVLRLSAFEGADTEAARPHGPEMEFHVRRTVRAEHKLEESLFSLSGNVVFPNFYASRVLARSLNARPSVQAHPERSVKAGRLNAMGLVDEILHFVCAKFRESVAPDAFVRALAAVEKAVGKAQTDALLLAFTKEFPPRDVYRGKADEGAWLAGTTEGVPNRVLALEELLLLKLANDNPAFEPFKELFDDTAFRGATKYLPVLESLETFFDGLPVFGPEKRPLVKLLRCPVEASPYSLPGQLDYMRRNWGLLLGPLLARILGGLDMIKEEEKPFFPGPGPSRVYVYEGMEHEYERFTEDMDWMPRVVMLAKSVLVWLHQLSVTYGRTIDRLDLIPDEELDLLASRGFNALWLIGLWERSDASRRIKQLCGNPEAAASAYSLFDYEIAGELGGWSSLHQLRERCAWRGIRLAADMVPNHTGIDSEWVRHRPDLFVQAGHPPFPGYTFNGENLSADPSVGIWLEDHYYNRSDAAVVFKRVDFRTGDTRYIYHGNDGTGMPWNDTAQIDFLKPEAREAVEERILHVARAFPIIRFDAAMVLAKRHFRRLWYPEPGSGGDIASRAEHALSRKDFDVRMPEEFWRQVVDRSARDAPDTLLLAEAFWMMEGYFVRTLGMHRVYNSAFMNMLKKEENAKFKETIKNTQEFDKRILKRFVNFMNNPDEETAVAQFGKGDKYFGVCTLMATLPGLPMFGHGQVEGFEEKYGMEYRRAYRDEAPDSGLVARHEREIFPILKRRHLFSGVDDFLLYDLWDEHGTVNQNVFVYSNGAGGERALVAYNNAYGRASGWVKDSAYYAEILPDGGKRHVQKSLAEALGLSGKEGRFLVFREQRSELWYLRPSKDVAAKGLHLALNGYESQVFLDVHEVEDDATGRYGTLCRRLGGAGAPDLSAALQDIDLAELYAAFAALLSPEFLAALRLPPGTSEKAGPVPGAPASKSKPGKPGKAEAGTAAETRAAPDLDPETSSAFAALPERCRAFARTALVFLEDFDGGAEALTERPEEAGIKAKKPPAGSAPTDPAERTAGALAAGFQILTSFLAEARSGGPDSFPASLAAAFPAAAQAAAALVVLGSLRALLGPEARGPDARALADHWCLDRKLREALQSAGMPGDEAWRLAHAAKTAAALHPDKPTVRELWKAWTSDEDGGRILGVNTWDGVEWFRAEGFDLFAPVSALAALFAPGGGTYKTREAAAAKLYSDLRKMEAKSGYKVDGGL